MTFHAACARILRAEAPRLGYTRQFTIYDQADSRRLVKRCIDELGVDPKRFTPAALHNQISDAKNKLRDAAAYRELVGSYFEQTVADVYELYEQGLHRMNAMDFDDLLVRTVNVLELFPEVRARYSAAFRHVLVDEYQDTNHAQYRLLQLLAGEAHRNLFVVGDHDQSIYGFRGADIRNILDFQDDFPDAAVVRLEQNYRSTQTILDAANAVIAHNRGRMDKTLWTDVGEGDPIKIRELDDEHAEARYVVGEIERLVDEGVSRAEIAVFYRTNAQSRVLEDTLVRREIAYQVIGGTKFYERAEIKDAIAYLTVLANPQDVVSFTRVANSPKRGIGQTSLSRVLAHAETMGIPVWDAAADAASGARAWARRRCARSGASWRRWPTLRDRVPRRASRSATCSRRCCTRRATSRRSRPSARSRPRAGSRTCRSWSRSRASSTPVDPGGRRDARRLPAADRARRRRRHPPRRRGHRDADDAAQRQGPRVPDRLHDRLRGGHLPALALDRRGHARGGAAALLRRDHARRARPDLTHARRRNIFGAAACRAAQPLPGRAAAGPRRPRGLARRRACPAAGTIGRPRVGLVGRVAQRDAASASFRLGDDVVARRVRRGRRDRRRARRDRRRALRRATAPSAS